MTDDLFKEICDALKDRTEWETKQDTWYRLRNRQIGRQFPPYPNAPDIRSGLSDAMEDKLKPYYIQQLYASDTIPSMVATKPQAVDQTSAAASWFDYRLKQRSNFQREMFVAIDSKLEGGFCPVKVYWDAKKKQLAFDACDRLHVIVPKGTQEYEDADWLVHVLHMSEAQYRRNDTYRQDDDFIKSIKGKGNRAESGSEAKTQSEEVKEGITCGQDDNQIVLWETYCRNKGSGQIYVETTSPLRHKEEVRPRFALPYNKHVFKDGNRPPFIKLRAEINGKSYYASRGVIELVAPWEALLNRSLNAQAEWGEHFNQPAYKNTGTGMVGNVTNWQRKPGSILPPGLDQIPPTPRPNSFAEDIQTTRAWAEYRVNVPDLGSNNHLMGETKGTDTATKINAILGQSGQVNDIRGRIFRLDTGELLNMAWSLLLQYDKDSLDYVLNGDLQKLDPESLHDEYDITPNGSPDSWNKGAMFQRRFALYQILSGNAYVPQGELVKWLMEAEDSQLVKRLYQDPGEQQIGQAEQQAEEIGLMLLGFPARIEQADDDKVHLSTMAGFFQRRFQTGEPVTPELARLALEHGSGHSQALEQKKDPMAKQIEQQMLPLVQQLGQIAAQPDPREVSNVVPMQQGMVQQNAAGNVPGGAPAASATQSNPKDNAIKAGNMLASWIKAGVPVNSQELNAVLGVLGLPPVVSDPVPQQQQVGAMP